MFLCEFDSLFVFVFVAGMDVHESDRKRNELKFVCRGNMRDGWNRFVLFLFAL